jgi:Family of unknown function (DUF5696)
MKAALFALALMAAGQTTPSRVQVTREGTLFTVTGAHQRFTIDTRDLALSIRAGAVTWSARAPAALATAADLVVRHRGSDAALRLADAGSVTAVPYDTGFKRGVKLTLSQWKAGTDVLDLTLVLTLALEGQDEDLAFDATAVEGATAVRRLDWPAAIDATDVDYTVLNTYRGTLLPRAWPTAFDPVRPDLTSKDSSEVTSNNIESWAMPWWGFQKGRAAMMVIVETPDDAAYRFSHPAGGPTVIGPRWRASLGRLRYQRAGRMVFFERGDYVDMAKRYRRHAIDTGLFVPLKQKAAASPAVARLIGMPQTRLGILKNLKADSDRFDTKDPSKNYSLTTYDDRVAQLRALKAKGVDRLHVVLTGWPTLGYDRQHPDGWPPSPESGGWDGLKRFADALRGLGYLFSIHDQYRDYYTDAPSWNPDFAIHEEDAEAPPQAFPGTRFGISKEGAIPYMRHWDGGKQSFLTPRFMLGHLQKNYAQLFDHGVHPDGSYLDVFGYVPPDEDFSPDHPTTRTESIRARVLCYTWARANLGLVGTEAAVDWVVPYVDYSSPLRAARAGIPVPLFDLVYHDAIITPYAPSDLRGFLNGGLPQAGLADMENAAERIRAMAQLQARVAFVEMTRHEFLDAAHRRERTTFADGTTVTVDWDAGTYVIKP